MIFNETQIRQKLKKQLGFADIPDDELSNYRIQLNSPTGNSDEFSLSVAAYIDAEIEITRQSYKDLEDMMKDPSDIEIGDSTECIITGDTSISKMEVNKMKYYDVSFAKSDTIHNYTVVVAIDPNDINSIQLAKEQSDQIKGHFTFIKERSADQLIGLEQIISFYQYVNLVSGLVNPNTLDAGGLTESIAARLSTIFEGADELEMIRKQFSS